MNLKTLQAYFACDGAGADTIDCGHLSRNLHIIDGIAICDVDRASVGGRPTGTGAGSHFDWYIELNKYNGQVQQVPHRYIETPGPNGPVGGGFLYQCFDDGIYTPWPIDWAECDVESVVLQCRSFPANCAGWIWLRWREFG